MVNFSNSCEASQIQVQKQQMFKNVQHKAYPYSNTWMHRDTICLQVLIPEKIKIISEIFHGSTNYYLKGLLKWFQVTLHLYRSLSDSQRYS